MSGPMRYLLGCTTIRPSMTTEDTQKPGDSYVQSFARGLAVIRAFDAQRPEQTLTEVASATGLTRAGARRILLTLQTLGYVEADGRLFRLTPKILELGFAYLTSMPFWNLAEPVMEQLSAQIHESCSAAVLDRTEIVYVLRVPTHKIMTINLSIGSRLPAYCTSMGRVLLSALDDAALDDTLAQSGIRAHTPRTITNLDELKATIAQVRQQGWGGGGPGTRNRADVDLRADPQSARADHRGDERQRQRAAAHREADGEGVSRPAAARRADRIRNSSRRADERARRARKKDGRVKL
ncbi:transcriptional regulator IclR family [Burkholderia dolosa AU0158]|nr:transcriptional regulator IclR family [Burkholderia dolosa AU0158]